MARNSITPSQAKARLAELQDRAAATFTDESYSTTWDAKEHLAQIALLRSRASRVLVYCTPRAGKTKGVLKVLANNAIAVPDSTNIYIAITKDQAKRIAWRPWKAMLRKWKILAEHSEADQATTFPNGAVVYFTGADDVAQINVLLGESFAGGVVVLDEC